MDLINKSIINDITLITIGKELIDSAYSYFQQLITEIEKNSYSSERFEPSGVIVLVLVITTQCTGCIWQFGYIP